MSDAGLERMLREMGRDEFHPSAALLQGTRRRLHATPLLRASLFVSLSILTLGWLAIIVALLSPGVSAQIKACLLSCGLAAWGGTLIGLVAARDSLVHFLRLLDTGVQDAAARKGIGS